ncbi:hypothetical protein N9Y78_00935 [Alphaproteobacteria bacterium]|nr:hypothetical protein [Alphaproteobacteria bacterium]
MNKNEDVYLRPTIITLAFLLLCFLIYSDFGDKYGNYLSDRELKEILLYSSITLFISGIVFVITKDKRNTIGQMAKSTINQQINNKMKSEISEYLLIIKGLSDEELGIAVLSALTLRKEILKSSGIDLMDPLIALQKNPDLTITFSKKHEELTAQNLPHLTVPYTVWIHTLRSVSNPVIRTYGRQMWKELSRGFNYIEGKKENYRWIYGVEPSSELAGQFPIGLDPSDIEKNDGVIKEELSSQDKEVKLKEYVELQKKGLITKEALTNLQIELLSDKNRNM